MSMQEGFPVQKKFQASFLLLVLLQQSVPPVTSAIFHSLGFRCDPTTFLLADAIKADLGRSPNESYIVGVLDIMSDVPAQYTAGSGPSPCPGAAF